MLSRRISLGLISLGLFALGVVTLWPVAGGRTTSVYSVLVIAYLVFKVGGAVMYRHRDPAPEGPDHPAQVQTTAVVVIPFYNEDPVLLRNCVRSVVAASRRSVTAIHLVDDGSADAELAPMVRRELAAAPPGVRVVVHVHDTNLGKREGLARAVESEPDAQVYLTVDSDTVLAPDAIDNLLAAFQDPDVTAATGLVLALNHDRNLLTRLIDLRYANAFMIERASYSRIGAVLCACGSLAAYRGDVMRDRLDDFVTQTFLGRPAVFGDDRRMTNYALQRGKVVFQSNAVAQTAVPERVGHYLRQQVRWNKSFFRESLWAVGNLPSATPAPWLSMLELVTWITFTAMLTIALVVAPMKTGMAVAGSFLVYIAAMAWIRSLRYLELRRDGLSSWSQVATFLLSPVYGFATLLVLLPLRLYSLSTLRDGGWGTRASGVEVSIAADS